MGCPVATYYREVREMQGVWVISDSVCVIDSTDTLDNPKWLRDFVIFIDENHRHEHPITAAKCLEYFSRPRESVTPGEPDEAT
jgi:hypothetical protein